jgi:hypothetical protein
VVVESDGTPIAAHIGDGDPFGLHFEGRGVVGWAWLGTAGKDPLENFDGDVLDGMGNT